MSNIDIDNDKGNIRREDTHLKKKVVQTQDNRDVSIKHVKVPIQKH